MITLPSGNLLHDYWKWLKMAIEIADLPSYKMVIFHSYVSLPEAISHFQTHTQVAMFRVTALGNEAGPQKTV